MVSHPSILVVDDEERIRQSLNGILKDEGYEVVEAKDGGQALFQLGLKYFSEGLLPQARESMTKCLAENPGNAEAQDDASTGSSRSTAYLGSQGSTPAISRSRPGSAAR
jgi:hypothetical protein